MNDSPHFAIDLRDGREILTASRRAFGILPSRKQSHPNSSIILAKGKYLLPNGVWFTMLSPPWRRR
jgi:hypothetical protein